MRILAADIGGTNSRFVHYSGSELSLQSLSEPLIFATSSVDSFPQLFKRYAEIKSPPFLDIGDYDRIVLSVAGPVKGESCSPPNINWSIDLSVLDFDHCVLINDFVAQAYATLLPDISRVLEPVKAGTTMPGGTRAVMGAGTGLGHCALLPESGFVGGATTFLPVASEAGHAAFAFESEQEYGFAEFVRAKFDLPYVITDMIVSGRGLSYLHEFLSGDKLGPADVAALFSTQPNPTQEWFSRFYARACRHYCLAVFATGGLVLSGGIAAKNPQLVKSDVFIKEFIRSPTQHELLVDIPIYLNANEDIGLFGAVYYGLHNPVSIDN